MSHACAGAGRVISGRATIARCRRLPLLALVCLLAGCGYWPTPRPAPSPLPPNVDSLRALTSCKLWPGSSDYQLDAAYDSDVSTVRSWLVVLHSDPAWAALPLDTYVAACYFHGPWAVPLPQPGSPVPDEAVVVVAQGGLSSNGNFGFHGRMKLARPHP